MLNMLCMLDLDPTLTFWLVQAIGIIQVIVLSASFFFKVKWKMMLLLTCSNILAIVVLLFSGTLSGALLVVGAAVRTIIYFLYSKFNKKPDIVIVLLVLVYITVITIVFWSGPLDLIMFFSLALITVATWQNNVTILRISYVIDGLLLLPYYIILGAYTSAVCELISAVSSFASLIKYSNTTENPIHISQRFITANKNLWGSNIYNYDTFDLVASNNGDKTSHSNYCVLKDYNNVYSSIEKIKEECKKNNIKEVVYFPFNTRHYNNETSLANTLNMFFPIERNDVLMKLIYGFNMNNTKCMLKEVEFKEVDETKIFDIVDLYIKCYFKKDSEKELTKSQKAEIQNLKNINLTDAVNGYKFCAYVAYYKGKPIAFLIMMNNAIEAFVTKVGTLSLFRQKNVATALLQYGITSQRAKGVQDIIIVTDKHSTSEEFYKFNNFKEIGQGYAFDVSDISKYKDFVENNNF
ncbi:MAG: YgjV family protein [Clostridia bacterium]|nr:YgjV family protein [Clostridia bacterium]